MKLLDEESVISLFAKDEIVEYSLINTSHGDEDFREVIIATLKPEKKLVIKIASNSFTTVERIKLWQRCTDEYLKQGYYCPRIFTALDGTFPTFFYKEKNCIAYAEEFSIFKSADQCENVKPFRDALYMMTAKIAQKKFDYTNMPSGYTLFELFPGDEIDEVTKNALEFRDYCNSLPEIFSEQTERMFQRWEENREKLRELYFSLPFSVFQADFNDTNVLVDENGDLVGIYDFNLAGRDEVLNYLFREIFTGSFDEELAEIQRALKVVSNVYTFSEEEIEAAPLIYRCVKPLWYTRVQALKSYEQEYEKVQICLDEMELAQIKEIDFRSFMKR